MKQANIDTTELREGQTTRDTYIEQILALKWKYYYHCALRLDKGSSTCPSRSWSEVQETPLNNICC